MLEKYVSSGSPALMSSQSVQFGTDFNISTQKLSLSRFANCDSENPSIDAEEKCNQCNFTFQVKIWKLTSKEVTQGFSHSNFIKCLQPDSQTASDCTSWDPKIGPQVIPGRHTLVRLKSFTSKYMAAHKRLNTPLTFRIIIGGFRISYAKTERTFATYLKGKNVKWNTFESWIPKELNSA